MLKYFLKALLVLYIILCNSCRSTFQAGKFYKVGDYYGTTTNSVLVLNKDKTYIYVSRHLPLGFSHRFYNSGIYHIKKGRIILNSYNQLSNNGYYSIKERIDTTINNKIKFTISRNPNDTLLFYPHLDCRIFVNNKFVIEGFKQGMNTSKATNELAEAIRFFDIELSNVMYKRYHIVNKEANVFEINFYKRAELDSLKNHLGAYFDNVVYIIKSKDTLYNEYGAELVRDKCQECDTSVVFKNAFFSNLKLPR